MTSHRRSALLATAGALLLAALAPSFIGIAYAQGLGTIVGTVTDPSGALVPDATVRVIDEGTSQSRETTTNAQGYKDQSGTALGNDRAWYVGGVDPYGGNACGSKAPCVNYLNPAAFILPPQGC